MEKGFHILDYSLKESNFYINSDVPVNDPTSAGLDVKKQISYRTLDKDNNIMLICLRLNARIRNLFEAYGNIMIRYCATVHFEGIDLSQIDSTPKLKSLSKLDKEIMDEGDRKWLKGIVSTSIYMRLYDHVRTHLWNLLKASSFPPMMLEDLSLDNITPKNEVKEDKEEDNINWLTSLFKDSILPLGYSWIIDLLQSSDETAKMVNEMKIKSKDIRIYEESQPYKVFLRFFEPVEYNHPEFDKCEDSYWNMLFQFIFAADPKACLKKGKNGLPELETQLFGGPVSKVDFNDLENITAICALDLFVVRNTVFINTEINEDFDTLSNANLLGKTNFASLFSNEEMEFKEFKEFVNSRMWPYYKNYQTQVKKLAKTEEI